MRLLKQLGALVFWFTLWAIIPAVALYRLALWAAIHTRISTYAITQSYIVAVGLLFLPTGFLVDYIYRRFIRERYSRKPAEVDEIAKKSRLKSTVASTNVYRDNRTSSFCGLFLLVRLVALSTMAGTILAIYTLMGIAYFVLSRHGFTDVHCAALPKVWSLA